MMRVYQRQETGVELRTEDVPFYPFFFLTDIRLLHGFHATSFAAKRCVGAMRTAISSCSPPGRRTGTLSAILRR